MALSCSLALPLPHELSNGAIHDRDVLDQPTGHQQACGSDDVRVGLLVSEAFPELGNLPGKFQVLFTMLWVIGKTEPLLKSLLVGKMGCHIRIEKTEQPNYLFVSPPFIIGG